MNMDKNTCILVDNRHKIVFPSNIKEIQIPPIIAMKILGEFDNDPFESEDVLFEYYYFPPNEIKIHYYNRLDNGKFATNTQPSHTLVRAEKKDDTIDITIQKIDDNKSKKEEHIIARIYNENYSHKPLIYDGTPSNIHIMYDGDTLISVDYNEVLYTIITFDTTQVVDEMKRDLAWRHFVRAVDTKKNAIIIKKLDKPPRPRSHLGKYYSQLKKLFGNKFKYLRTYRIFSTATGHVILYQSPHKEILTVINFDEPISSRDADEVLQSQVQIRIADAIGIAEVHDKFYNIPNHLDAKIIRSYKYHRDYLSKNAASRVEKIHYDAINHTLSYYFHNGKFQLLIVTNPNHEEFKFIHVSTNTTLFDGHLRNDDDFLKYIWLLGVIEKEEWNLIHFV